MGNVIRTNPPIAITGEKNLTIENARCVTIRCSSASPNPLYIGVNENASSKFQLDQGDAYQFGPFSDGDIIGKLELRFKFSADDVNNMAIVLVDEVGPENKSC